MNKKDYNSLKTFLSHFTTSGATPTTLNGFSKSNGQTSMVKNSLYNVVTSNEKSDTDAYFVPNLGGTRMKDIKVLTSVFIDLDVGRDKNKKYMNTYQVNKRKKVIWTKVNKCPIKPSLAVETRNGYHVYWLLNPEPANKTNLAKWNGIESYLCSHFADVGSDKHVLKPNQILRLPYTQWNKTHEGWPSFKVRMKLNRSNPKRYDLDSLSKMVVSLPSTESSRPTNVKYSDNTWRGSFRHEKPVYVATTSTPVVTSGGIGADVMRELQDFLQDASTYFYKQNMPFMANTAKRLLGEIGN